MRNDNLFSRRNDNQEKITRWIHCILFLTPVLIVSLSILCWYVRPLEGEVFLGFSQVEQPVYLVLSKHFAEEGSFVFYSSPYAIEKDFPKIYSHLLPIALGMLWKLTDISLITLWWLVRVVFGPMMLLLGYKILEIYITERRYLIAGAAFLGFGGGLAYLHAFTGTLFSRDDFMTGWMLLESPYDWWFTNLFRVLYYPLETFTHFLFFLSVYFFLKKRFAPSAVAFFLTWWAHPFTGGLLTAIYTAFFVIEILVYRRNLIKIALPFFAVGALFSVYYLIWIPSFPMASELMTNFRLSTSAGHLSPLLYPSAWGIFLFLPFLNGREILKEEKARFLLYWVLVALILINHDLFIRPGFQPMHFTRGYFFFPLCILAVLGLRRRLQDNNHAKLVLFFLILFSLPDNALFVYKFVTLGGDYAELEVLFGDEVNPHHAYHLNPLRIKDSQWDIIQRLNKLDGREVILASDNIINFLIPLYTDHKTLLGHTDYVPYFDEKRDLSATYFRLRDPKLLNKYGVTIAIHPRRDASVIERSRIIYQNSDYIIVSLE